MLRCAAVALLVTACSGGAPAAPRETFVPITPPPAATTDAPIIGSGVITFGTAYDADTLAITAPKTSFKASSKKIAWSAALLGNAGATTLTFILASKSKTGAERIIIKQETDVSNPSFDTLANDADLSLLVDRKPGTYVMRYLRESDVLAEGEFTLTK